jgi:hypothetical protein
MTYFDVLYRNVAEVLRKTMKNLSRSNRSLGFIFGLRRLPPFAMGRVSAY